MHGKPHIGIIDRARSVWDTRYRLAGEGISIWLFLIVFFSSRGHNPLAQHRARHGAIGRRKALSDFWRSYQDIEKYAELPRQNARAHEAKKNRACHAFLQDTSQPAYLLFWWEYFRRRRINETELSSSWYWCRWLWDRIAHWQGRRAYGMPPDKWYYHSLTGESEEELQTQWHRRFLYWYRATRQKEKRESAEKPQKVHMPRRTSTGKGRSSPTRRSAIHSISSSGNYDSKMPRQRNMLPKKWSLTAYLPFMPFHVFD